MTGRVHACGKARYPSRAVARRELDRIRRKAQQRETRPARVYACPDCGGWHLTSSPADPDVPLGPRRRRPRAAYGGDRDD